MLRAALVAVICAAGVASAEPTVALRIAPPSVFATVRGVPSTTPERVTLGVGKQRIPAAEIRSYAQSGEPLALVVLFDGQEIWVGNDQIEPTDSAARYPGALATLVATFDRVRLDKLVPAGSVGTLIGYADRVDVRVPLGPIAGLTGAAFGTQRDYYHRVGSELVAGLEKAITALQQARAARKVLLVIGDGNDTDNQRARGRLLELAEVAARSNIETRAIVHRSAASEPQDVLSRMIPDAVEVASAEALGPVLERTLRGLDDRFEARFPGETLPWDNLPHAAIVRVADTELEATLNLPRGYELPRDTSWRWRLVGAVIAVLGIAGIAIAWRATAASRSRDEA